MLFVVADCDCFIVLVVISWLFVLFLFLFFIRLDLLNGFMIVGVSCGLLLDAVVLLAVSSFSISCALFSGVRNGSDSIFRAAHLLSLALGCCVWFFFCVYF